MWLGYVGKEGVVSLVPSGSNVHYARPNRENLATAHPIVRA
jgi:hypothetical protein